MENDTTVAKEGLLEPVLPGSVTFDTSILAPLQNNYLYEGSKECFRYSSAHLIDNAALQRRYLDFRAQKREHGYSEVELEESFGFLLFDSESMANKLVDTGLVVGQSTCTTLGDSTKGVYISKYSDCLDQKPWYDGRTGYIVILKLTKGRVKEVTENYTQNFTPPTAGFDCHVSEQLSAVSTTTSSFLAFDRTQYYMYELLNGGDKAESCPRHVCPFAIVAFSYGKPSTSLELKQKSQEKTSFHYQPWCGQLKIKSHLFDIGLKSAHGGAFPASLPKTVQVDHAIGVSELKKALPQAVFETSLVGEVSLDGHCFNLYDVAFFEERSDLSLLIEELKENDVALVVCLDDRGFLVLLHSSHFLSYEGAVPNKSSALQGMFIFPNTRTVPRETKIGYSKHKISSEVLQVLPALNYAESEMEKCPPSQHEEPLGVLEKHLQNFAALICPGLSGSPAREASMFPDQYDVPDGFPLMAPKWTEEAGTRLRTYLDKPSSFQIPVARASELLAAGKQERGDDHDDDVYYCISSPEELPSVTSLGSDATHENDATKDSSLVSDEVKDCAKQQALKLNALSETSHAALLEKAGAPGTFVVATTDNPVERTEPSPKSGDLPTKHYVNTVSDSEKTSEKVLKEAQTTGVPVISSTEDGTTALSVTSEASQHSQGDVTVKSPKNVSCESDILSSTEGQTSFVEDSVTKVVGPPTFISTPIASEHSDASHTKLNVKVMSRRHGRRRKGVVRRHLKGTITPPSIQNTTLNSTTTPEQSENDLVLSTPSALPKKDWRSLPRRKRQWNADASLKRVLRSDHKTGETESLVEKNTVTCTGLNVTENSTDSTAKRKEGSSMRERYGLKTIITDCGKVFVPHGSDVATEDVVSPEKIQKTDSEKVECVASCESPTTPLETVERETESHLTEPSGSCQTEEGQDTSSVTNSSPSKERPSVLSSVFTPASLAKSPPSEIERRAQHMPLTHIQNIPVITSSKALSSQQPAPVQGVKNDISSCPNPDQPLDSSPEKIKSKTKGAVYRAISISKLKTVLKRAKRTSPGTENDGKSLSDGPEHERKKLKHGDVGLSPDSGKLSINSDKNTAFQHSSESAGNQDPRGSAQSKQSLVSWRELKTSSTQEKLRSMIAKENGCINFDTDAPNEVVKQADRQHIWDSVGGKGVSSDDKSSKEGLATGVPLPSDALNLLADLALGANSEKTLPNQGSVLSQEAHVGIKTSSSRRSVLHNLLRSPSAKFKLPPKSSSSEGLVATGDLILEISKEHSYSQPTSLPSGLAGAGPQVPPPVGCDESLLSLNAGIHLKLPDQRRGTVCPGKGSKKGWRHLASLDAPLPSDLGSNVPMSRLLDPDRHIVEKEGSIQMTRIWTEVYDFRFDSKFTNDELDKTVTRALHGKWDFNIEDTSEQVYLILHMWIGLFYSADTFRFFHFDHNYPMEERILPSERREKSISPVHAPTTVLEIDLTSKEGTTSPVHPVPDVLDLSVKLSGPEGHTTVLKGSGEENLDSRSVIQSRQDHIHENKLVGEENSGTRSVIQSRQDHVRGNKLPARTLPSSSNVSQLSHLEYRTTVDILDDSPMPEHDNSDQEFTNTDNTYTGPVENIRAYSNLCEQASSMSICEQKSSNLQKQSMPEPVRVKSAGKMSFDPKSLAIFHQVVEPLRHMRSPNVHDQVLGRKFIDSLKCLSSKDKTGDVTRVCGKSGSKDGCEAAKQKKSDSAPVVVNSENSKVEKVEKLLSGSTSTSATAVCESNDAKVTIHSKIDTICEPSVCDDRNDMPVLNVVDNTSTGVRDDEAVKGASPVRCDVRCDSPDVIQNDKEQDRAMPGAMRMRDVRDDKPKQGMNEATPAVCEVNNDAKDVRDVIDDTPVDVRDNAPRCDASMPDVGDKMSLRDVRDDISKCDDQNQTFSGVGEVKDAMEGAKMVHDVRDDTPVHVQDVDDGTKDVEILHDVKDDVPVQVHDVDEMRKDGVEVVQDVGDDVPVQVHDVDEMTKDGVEVVQDVGDDVPVQLHDVGDMTKDGVEIVQDVGDDIPVQVHDVDETRKDGVEVVQDVGDDVPVQVHDVDEMTKDGVEIVQDVGDDVPVQVHDVDEMTKDGVEVVQDVGDDVPVQLHDVDEMTKDGVEIVQDVGDDVPVQVHDVDEMRKDGVEIVQDVGDDVPVQVHDVDEMIKDGVKIVQDVGDDVPVQVQDVAKELVSNTNSETDPREPNDASASENDATDSIDVEICDGNDSEDDTPERVYETNISGDVVEPVHYVTVDSPVDTQDVTENANDGVNSRLESNDFRSVNAHDDIDSGKDIIDDKVFKASDTTEEMFEKNRNTQYKPLTGEAGESERREVAQLVCNVNSEVDAREQNVEAALKIDATNSIDMELCDGNESEDDSGEKVCETNVSGDVALVEQSSSSTFGEELVKSPKSEMRTETWVTSSDREHTKDNTRPEMAQDASPDHVSSTAQQFIMLKQCHHSPVVDGTGMATENESETTVLVAQVKTPEISLDEAERAPGDVSPSTDIVTPEPRETNDCVLRVSVDVHNVDSPVFESQEKVPEMMDPDHKCASPTISVTPPHKFPETQNDGSPTVLPAALQLATDFERTSRCSTPTQDEMPYKEGSCQGTDKTKGSQDNHTSDKDLHSPNRSPLITELSPASGTHLCASVEKPTSDALHHNRQFSSQDSCWPSGIYVGNKYEESKSSLNDEPISKRNFRHFDKNAHDSSRDSVFQENQPGKDLTGTVNKDYQFYIAPKQYEEHLPEPSSSWTHGPGFRKDGPDKLREWYTYDDDDDDDEGSFTHFRNSTFAQKEVAHMPVEAGEGHEWAQEIHYADSLSKMDTSFEKVCQFRHQADLERDLIRGRCASNEESESPDNTYSRKKHRKSCDYKREKDFDRALDYNIRKTISCLSDQTKRFRTHASTPYSHTQQFDWKRYFRRVGMFSMSEKDDMFHDPPSIVTVFDKKGNRAIFESQPTQQQSVTHSSSQTNEDSIHNRKSPGLKSDYTQSLMELEYLVFSEKMNHMLKNCRTASRDKVHRQNPVENPMTIQFSKLDEEDLGLGFQETWTAPTKFRINVKMSEKKGKKETIKHGRPLHFQSFFSEQGNEAACSRIADINKEFAKSYSTMMDDICAGKPVPRQSDGNKRKSESASGSKQSGFCGHIKKDMLDHLHDNLNSIVRQACKIKYRFYILVTSADPFFDETKDLLEEEGHTAVGPCQFDLDGNNRTPLLIILRNEDIAQHICKVPHLLKLKKSSRVLFAGIDRPDDVVNLTHQELFAKGGFVVFDDTAMEQLSLENMKKVASIMEKLEKKGKWKWFLHYRDSRKFRENARGNPEAQKRKHFIDCCQEAGLVEVLPYHDCDGISRDRPDYLHCLIRLQIQNISARLPVFITDTPADSYEKNGILIMNIYSFTQIVQKDTCSVS